MAGFGGSLANFGGSLARFDGSWVTKWRVRAENGGLSDLYLSDFP
jgi:hypothetical protein